MFKPGDKVVAYLVGSTEYKGTVFRRMDDDKFMVTLDTGVCMRFYADEMQHDTSLHRFLEGKEE